MKTLITILAVFAAAGAVCCGGPISTVDDLGRPIKLAGPPRRIISLEPSVTEVLYAVGCERRIVADDFYSDYPIAAKAKPHVNGVGPSREQMLGLHPDLIILFDQTFTVQKADEWQRTYGVPVYVTNGGTYKAVERDILQIGTLAVSRQRANQVVKSMDDTLTSVTAAVAKQATPKVFVVVWNNPLMTAGRGTFIDDLIHLAGGVDVASAHVVGYPTYSPEQLVADDPDVILTGTTGSVTLKQKVSSLSSLNLCAETSGFSFAVPDDWTVRPGPRLALGLEAIARVLHPKCFNQR